MNPSARGPRVLTALDLPHGLNDLTTLVHDLYLEPGPYDTQVLIAPQPPVAAAYAPGLGPNAAVLRIEEDIWTRALTTSLTRHADGQAFDLIHCHQLTAPTVHALADAFPDHPRLGIVHPFELREAAHNQSRLAALQRGARSVHALAAPSETVALTLRDLVPGLDPDAFVVVPTPVPDHLLGTPPIRNRPRGKPRVLFAGAVEDQPAHDEAGVRGLLRACREANAEVVMAISSKDIGPVHELAGSLGVFLTIERDLSREKFTELLGTVDAIAAPEHGPLASSRNALYAQARGVPVIYQLGSGMAEILSGAVGADFADVVKAAEIISAVCTETTLLTKLRTDARAGAEKHRLSRIQRLLARVGGALLTPTGEPTAS